MARKYTKNDSILGMSIKEQHIYYGDCITVMENYFPAKSIDLVFADPPYNLSGNGLKWSGSRTGGDWFMVNESWDNMPATDYLIFTERWVKETGRVLKDGGSMYTCCTYHNIGEVVVAMKLAGLKINNIITWHKVNAMPNMTRRVFTHSSEFVVWGVKGKNWTFNYDELKKLNPDKQKDGSQKQMRDVWTMPLVQGTERLRSKNGRALHPTQKPEEMLRRIILASSEPNDLVLDPFLGSGTTAVVAKRLGRRWVGIETKREYIRMAKARVANTSIEEGAI